MLLLSPSGGPGFFHGIHICLTKPSKPRLWVAPIHTI